jgi:hypothetical protein
MELAAAFRTAAIAPARRASGDPEGEISQLLQERGQSKQAGQAERELPQQVDPEQDSDLLSKFGLDPQDVISKDVISKFGGGLLG